LTSQPLKGNFGNCDSFRRIGKWAIEHSEYVIDFEKRTAIKSYVLADFIADWMEPSSYIVGTIVDTLWQICCYGAWGVSGVGAVAILKSPSGIKMKYAARMKFKLKLL
jgi:hypothetical protein